MFLLGDVQDAGLTPHEEIFGTVVRACGKVKVSRVTSTIPTKLWSMSICRARVAGSMLLEETV